MSSAKLTLIGLNYYMKIHDNDLFGSLTLPDGIDKEILTNNILLNGGEFEVLYSDPNFLKDAIGLWGKKWQRTFEKWVKALSVEYNPLENYDRLEEWTDKNTGTVSDKGYNNSTSNTGGYSSNSSNENISAYNSDVMRPDSSSSSKDNYASNGKSDSTMGNTRTDNLTSKHTGRMHGNIGVTTSQQMLESELDIAKWNIYEHITDLFLQEFVIPLF